MTSFPTTLSDAVSMGQFANIENACGCFEISVQPCIFHTVAPPNPKHIQEMKCQAFEITTLGSVDPNESPLVAVIGCGYVGTHLIQAFSRQYDVLGFDVSEQRLEHLRAEFQSEGTRATLTTNPEHLIRATHILVSVPTLVLKDKTIDTSYIRDALSNIDKYARSASTVVIESSVAVGMTRQLLGPLAKKRGFFAGMSPEVSAHLKPASDLNTY